jgi:hypothetical protein
VLTETQLQAFYRRGVECYAGRACAEQVIKNAPTDPAGTKYGMQRVIEAAMTLGAVLIDQPAVKSLSDLARLSAEPPALLACALGCPALPDGTPGPVAAGMIDRLVGTLYFDPDVPVYPEAIVVVRPTTLAPRTQTRRRTAPGLTRRKRQSFYTGFAQSVYGADNRRDYALPVGAVLSPTSYDLHHPDAAPELALAITRPADYLARHFGYVASRMDALRHDRAIDPAWLFSENRIQLEEAVDNSQTDARSETLARQVGFGRVLRAAMGPGRIVLVHVGDGNSAGTGLHPALRYRPPDSDRRLNGTELHRALRDPKDPMHTALKRAVWAWGPDLPNGVPTKVMAGELIDTRDGERFILVVVNNGYYDIYLAIPYVGDEQPLLSTLDLLRIALAVRAWEGDSPYLGRARRRSTEYVKYVNFPALDASTREAAFLSGASAHARRVFREKLDGESS